MPSAPKSAGTDAPDAAYRLPRTVSPSHYRLLLDVDLDRAAFSGTADIALEIHDQVGEITLNAAELEITDARLELAGGEPIGATVALDDIAERRCSP